MELIIVFKDVLGIDEATAREVKRRAVSALVAGAIQRTEAEGKAVTR